MADDPLDFTDQFNTPLSLDQQFNYDSKYGPNDSYDYDMQGFHKANPDAEMAPGQHFPDTFKKPNHPTFSDQSQYHTGAAALAPPGHEVHEGGHWDLLGNGSFAFTPGASNLEHHSTQELLDYFKKYEPNNHLILPGY